MDVTNKLFGIMAINWIQINLNEHLQETMVFLVTSGSFLQDFP
jgi:hypothetical protein